MHRIVYIFLLIDALCLTAHASPAPTNRSNHDILIKREANATTKTVTVTSTVTSTKLSTVTTCPTGSSSTSRPLSSSTNTSPTTSTIIPTISTSTSKPTSSGSTSSTTKTSSSSVPSSTGDVTFDGCQYHVPAAGTFKHKDLFDFTSGIPKGLQISQYEVLDTYAGAPYDHTFDKDNVFVDDGILNLLVPGIANPHAGQVIGSAEVTTVKENIQYASVRTNASFSTVPGTCHGIFFYKNDNQETDIEYLTDPYSDANNINGASASSGGSIPIWYSNQAVKSGNKATQEIGPAPEDVEMYHEYRIDWTKDFTAMYVDGVLQKKFTKNVPTQPGAWIWNNWANGDYGWSAGPPAEDNIFKIKSIEMYYNTNDNGAKTGDSNAC